jgi:serine/threonine protein kinase
MTPGNPLALLSVQSSPRVDGGNAKPIGSLGEEFLVYGVRRGGMGEVFLCGGVNDDRKAPSIALKTFQKRFFFDHATREGFVRECAIWSRLSGIPHIMFVLDIRLIDQRPFAMMPAILSDCVSVRTLLKTRTISPDDALRFAWQTAFALKAGQERLPGLVHGDLKPDNLLLYEGAVFVSDFGLARVVSQNQGLAPLEGTWAYRAPECWEDVDALTVASDVYAFGVVLYEMLTGRLPFDASSSSSWRDAHTQHRPAPINFIEYGELGAGIGKLALDCMEKEPKDRPASFDAICKTLSELGHAHDIIHQFMVMVETVRWKDALAGMRNELRLNLIRSLLTIDLPQMALEELENYPADLITGEVAILKGTVMSLNGRDEEAIRLFDLAMEGSLSDEGLTRCMTEKGLSLKRLHRYSEAIALYETLLDNANDRFAPELVVNFATVLLTAKEFTRARDILNNFVRRKPGITAGWANLGLAYKGLNDNDAAIEAFRRAIRLDPSLANVQVWLAEVLLNSGHVQEAYILLNAAYDQGYQSEQWITNMIAASTLLGHTDVVESLMAAIQRDLEPRVGERIQQQVMALMKQGASQMLVLSARKSK